VRLFQMTEYDWPFPIAEFDLTFAQKGMMKPEKIFGRRSGAARRFQYQCSPGPRGLGLHVVHAADKPERLENRLLDRIFTVEPGSTRDSGRPARFYPRYFPVLGDGLAQGSSGNSIQQTRQHRSFDIGQTDIR
jgi:hypothetical protein